MSLITITMLGGSVDAQQETADQILTAPKDLLQSAPKPPRIRLVEERRGTL